MWKNSRFDNFVNRTALSAFVIAMLFILSAQTSENKTSTPGLNLPPEFLSRLDSLRKADDLQEWLANCIEYLGDKPAERISFLYAAESLAWRKPRTNDEKLVWFYLFTNQGYYEMYRGNIIRSIDAYEKAYRYYFDNPVPGTEDDVLEYVLKPLGNNYTRLGDYDRAFFIQEKSLSIALRLNDSSQTASIYHNLATSARWKGQLSLAEEHCLKGLSYVPGKKSRRGLLLSAYAEILLLQQKFNEAESQIQEAIKILEQNLPGEGMDAANWLRGAYQGYGEILKEKGRLNDALGAYDKAGSILNKYFREERRRESAKLNVLSGQVLLQLNQPQKAIGKFNDALVLLIPSFQLQSPEELPAVNELYAENTIIDAINGKASGLLATGKKENALDCFMLLFRVEQKLRFEFFSYAAKQQQQKETRQWVETAMETAYELMKTTGKKEITGKILMIAELSKAQLLLDEIISNFQYNRLRNKDTLLNKQFRLMQAIALAERETMLNDELGTKDSGIIKAKKEMQYELSLAQKEVKNRDPLFSSYMEADNIPTEDDLLKIIPDSATIIEFFTGQKNIYVLAVTNKRIKEVRKIENAPLLQQAIKDFVFTWFQNGPEKMMNAPEQYYRDAHHVYNWLLGKAITQKQDQLIIVPDGIIGYLPFDALVTDSLYRANIDQWPFLIKQNNLFFSYSLQTWQQQQLIVRSNKLFAGFFISFDSSQQASLPAVKKEYSLIRNSIKGNFFTEEQASLKEFQKNLSRVNLLHISTHAYLQGNETIPVLQLADDKFFLFELHGRTFQPQLVVLSACRTGHGLLSEGEGIISLARGFTATGAAGIVAGLWNMNDESTAQLMGDFYHHLKGDHHPAAALNAAKKDWLQKKHEQYFKKLPYFWAGMIYVGNNQPVELVTEKTAMPLIWIAVAVLLVVLGIIYFFRRQRK